MDDLLLTDRTKRPHDGLKRRKPDEVYFATNMKVARMMKLGLPTDSLSARRSESVDNPSIRSRDPLIEQKYVS